jgi:hypothetical protein
MSSGKILGILRTAVQYQTQHTVWYDLWFLAYK